MSPLRLPATLFALFLVPCAGFCQEPFAPGPLLEAQELAWTATPAASFSALTGADAHDATDAVGIAAGAIGAAVLETTVSGPALVSWWWRRTENDTPEPSLKLFFLYDGSRLADHDEQNRWEKVSIQISAGPHTLRWWVPATAGPTARAVVDQVTVTPGGALPESAAMNDPNGVWLRTELGTGWNVSTLNTHDGTSAAEARPTLRNQATSLRRLISGPAHIAWWWQLQGNDENELKAKLRRIETLDTTQVASWDLTNPVPWQRVSSVLVPPGWHVINWRYDYDDPAATAPAAGAAGQIDEFTSVPVTLQEALGLPNQVWNFGGTWEVAAESADTATPGSITPASIAPAATAWIESSFTGPVLLRWDEQRTNSPPPVASLSIDGVPAPQATLGTVGFFAGAGLWKRNHAHLPAGLHTVRWTFANPTAVDAWRTVRFDHPKILPLMAENLQAALGTATPAFFENGEPASQIVANAPNGPEGATALRLSGTNTPLVAMGGSSPVTGPRLVSYFHRRVGGNVESLRESIGGIAGAHLNSTADWQERSFFLANPILLGWDASLAAASAFEIDGFSFDAPAADVDAFLARTGMDWNAPAGAAVVRIADPSLPGPQGELLFLLPSAAPLTVEVNGPGLFAIETTDRFAAPNEYRPSNTLHVSSNGPVMDQAQEELGDRKRIRFAVSEGPQTLSISGSSVAVLSLAWQPAAPAVVVSEIARDGLEGTGMTFSVTDPAALLVRNPEGSSRRVLTLQAAFPMAELRSTVTGPGLLSFEWRGAGSFWYGAPAVPAAPGAVQEWSKVRVAIPPGSQLLRWEGMLDLDHFQWEPRTLAINPPAGLLGSAARTSGPLWRENRGAEGEVLVAPWDGRPEFAGVVKFSADGPGIFVCEARLLISHRMPRFSFVDGSPEIELSRNGEPVLRTMACHEWLPLSIPIGSGSHELTAGMVMADLGGGPSPMLPATLEFRNAAILPQRTAAQVAQPGITWEPDPAGNATAAEFVTSRGNSVLWHLDAPTAGTEPQLIAEIQGPGMLEWEFTHQAGVVTLSSNGAAARELQNGRFYDPPFMPSHQLLLPAGTHRVIWTQYSLAFIFGQEPPALSMALRWLPSANPPLAAALSLPLNPAMHFSSDGGWEPAPFDLATPWQRLRTRFAGPATVLLTLPGDNVHTAWIVRGDRGFDESAASLESIFVVGGELRLNFTGESGGDRGAQMAPYARSMLGRIPASSAMNPDITAETFAQWAARLGVPADPGADPDRDGLSSLIESALGTDPALAEFGALQALPGDPAAVRFLWPPYVPGDVTRTIETSADLIQWTAAVPTVSGGTAEVRLTPPARYARMRVVKVP